MPVAELPLRPGHASKARWDGGDVDGHSVHIVLRYYRAVSDDARREAAKRADVGLRVDERRKAG